LPARVQGRRGPVAVILSAALIALAALSCLESASGQASGVGPADEPNEGRRAPGARGSALRQLPLVKPVALEADEDTLLVRARGAGVDAVRAIAADRGVRAGRDIGRTRFVVVHTAGRARSAVLAELRRDARVEVAQPNYERRMFAAPNDILLQKGDQQYYLPITRLTQAWDRTQGSTSVTIAVVDTGVDADHPELASRLVAGYDFVGDDNQPDDDSWHGTMVAGVAAAQPNNGLGIAGAAWNASVMPLKALDGDGFGTDADVAAAITWAADHGADVLNLSLGGPGDSPVLRAAIDYAVARDVLVVAASGNDGSSRPQYPAAYPGVVAVGATDWSGNVTGFSSYGAWLDLVAPGFEITSSYPALGAEPAFATASGTSFAAPFVAGVAALVRAQNPGWTPSQVADQLRRSARDAGPRGIDASYGHGIVDAYASVGGPPAPPFRAPPGDPKEPNGTPDRAYALTDPYYDWATISPQGDVDSFYKQVSAPGWLRFRVESGLYTGNPEAEMSPILQAFGPDLRPLGEPVWSGTTTEYLTVPARVAGRYYLRVTSREGSRSPHLNAGQPWGYTIKTEYPSDPPPGRWDYQRIPIVTDDYSNFPEATAVADVTGDGRNDVLLTTWNDLKLRLYAQRTDGYLEQPVVLPTVGGRNSGLGVDTGDLDGDGKLDAAVAGWNVRVYHQRNGALTDGVVVSDVQGAMQLRIGDFDHDGRRDIVVAWGDCTSARGLALLRNTASGWIRSDTPTPELEHELEVGDVNGDGRLDVAGMSGNCTSGGVIDVFRQKADGTFAREAIVPPYEGRDMEGIEVADVTGDSRDDIVVSRTAEMRVYAQAADGTLTAPRILAADGAGAVESGDVNADGRRDLVGEGGTFLRQADGSWVKEGGIGHSYYLDPNLLSLGDVNGDGKLDGAIADGTWPGYLSLYRQTSTAWPPPVWVRDTQPTDFAEGAAPTVAPTITFGRTLSASSVTSSTVRLENASTGAAVAASPSYDAAARRVTVQPSGALAAGPYLVRVGGVVDTSGTAMPEQSFRFTVGTTADTTPPETYVTSGPWGAYIGDIGWDFMSSEPGGRFECHWGTGWQRCNSPSLFAGSGPSAFTSVSQFRAIDAAGNVDPTPAVRTWTAPPANDAFSAAATISGSSGSVTSTNTMGSLEPGEPAHAGVGGGMSVWYRWTAPSNGRVVFDTIGSTFDTVLAVYTGASVEALSEVASNDQAYGTNWSKVSFVTSAGVTYQIAVAGYPWPRVARGTFTLTWAPPVPGAPDTVPPSVRLTAPADRATVAGDVVLAADAGDDVGIARVEFFVSGVLAGSDAAAPYQLTWSTRTFPNDGYTIEARAVDTSGNMTWSLPRTVFVDNSIPETIIDSGPSGNTTSRDATFIFYSSASGARFECTLDGAPWSACSSPKTFNGLGDGAHTFSVRAINAAGTLDPSPATRTWTVSPPPPAPANDLFVNAAAIGAASGSASGTTVGATREPGEPYHYASTGSTSIWYRWTPSASGTAVFDTIGSNFDTVLAAYSGSSLTSLTRLASDDDGAGSRASRVSFPVTAGTTYHIAVDGYGTATGSVTLNWRAPSAGDTTPPTVTLTAPADGAVVRGTIDVAADASDNTAVTRVEFLANGSAIATDTAAPYAVAWDSAEVGDGSVTLAARAFDEAGNTATSARSIRVDNTPPDTTIGTKPASLTNATRATFEFSSPDSTATFACSLDAAPFADCSSPASSSGLAHGAHTFAVRAIDAAGNVDPTPASYTWSVDTKPPETVLGTTPEDPTGSTSARFIFSSEAGARFECRLDDGRVGPCASPHEFPGPLADGSHRFEVVAIDAAGNRDQTPATYTWTIDSGLPETTITQAPASPTNATTASFAYSSTKADSRFECSLDGGAVGCGIAYIVGEGEHRFTVAAVSTTGRRDPSPASYSWTVDTTAPETTLAPGPASPTSARSASLQFSSEPAASFECRLDDERFEPCLSPQEYAGPLAEGEHRFWVRAIDRAGNVDATPASGAWVIDATAPTTQILAGPHERTYETSAAFSLAASEPGASFECALDGAPLAPCADAVGYSGLGTGPHEFSARATDPAGNRGATAIRRWTILTPPQAASSTPAPLPAPAPQPSTEPAQAAPPEPTPPPPAPPATVQPNSATPAIWIGSGRLALRAKRRALILIGCPAPTGGCRGSVSLQLAARTTAGPLHRLAVRLGSGSFRLGAGERRRIAVRLTSSAVALLRARGRLTARALVVSRDVEGRRTTTARRIVLHWPKSSR
jgi:type VII secretion-associated serine protease mycosin